MAAGRFRLAALFDKTEKRTRRDSFEDLPLQQFDLLRIRMEKVPGALGQRPEE